MYTEDQYYTEINNIDVLYPHDYVNLYKAQFKSLINNLADKPSKLFIGNTIAVVNNIIDNVPMQGGFMSYELYVSVYVTILFKLITYLTDAISNAYLSSHINMLDKFLSSNAHTFALLIAESLTVLNNPTKYVYVWKTAYNLPAYVKSYLLVMGIDI